jgi:peptidoglycan/LPS O-acetylase OafA/YrhL
VPGAACGVNCPDWSISVEAFFYGIFPLLLVTLERKPTRLLVGIVVFLYSVALLFGLWVSHQEKKYGGTNVASVFEYVSYHPVINFSQFVMGAVAGTILIRHPSLHHLQAYFGGLLLLSGVSVIFWVELAPPASEALFRVGILSPIWAVLLIYLALDKSLLAVCLSAPPIVLLGEASYAVYLYQTPVRRALDTLPFSSMVTGALAFGVLIIASILSFIWFERPVRAMLRRAGFWFGRRGGAVGK